MKTHVFFLFFVTFICACHQYPYYKPPRYNERFYRLTQDQIEQTIRANRHYWQRDSIGQNGFRNIFAGAVLEQCHFSGQPWDKWRAILGKPNYQTVSNDSLYIRYFYNLTCYPDIVIKNWKTDYYYVGGNYALQFDVAKSTNNIALVIHFVTH